MPRQLITKYLRVSVKYNTPKYKKYQARRGESDTFIVFKFDAYLICTDHYDPAGKLVLFTNAERSLNRHDNGQHLSFILII